MAPTLGPRRRQVPAFFSKKTQLKDRLATAVQKAVVSGNLAFETVRYCTSEAPVKEVLDT